MVFIGFIILGFGFLCFWQIGADYWPIAPLYMFYIAFMIMALGQGMGSWVPMMTTINNWFSRRMAMAMGWANWISRCGALIVVPLIGLGISSAIGWQGTALVIAVVVFAAAFPLSLVIRNQPEDMGLQLQDEAEAAGRARGRPAQPQRAARSDRAAGHPHHRILVHRRGARPDQHDYPGHYDPPGPVSDRCRVRAAHRMGGNHLYLVAMWAQLIGGYVGDRFSKRVGIFVFTTIQAGAVVVLTFSTQLWMFYAFAVAFGLGFGGRNPLTTSIRGEYFGRGNFGKILGISTIPMNLLLLAASPFAGYMYDWQQSYTVAFLVLSGFNFARRHILPVRQAAPDSDGAAGRARRHSHRARRGPGTTARRPADRAVSQARPVPTRAAVVPAVAAVPQQRRARPVPPPIRAGPIRARPAPLPASADTRRFPGR